MLTNNQNIVGPLIFNAITNNIHGNSNRNPVRAQFSQMASNGNWGSAIMDELYRMGLGLYSHLVNGGFGPLPQGLTDEALVNSIVNTDFGIVDLYYATWCLSHRVQLGPQELQQAQAAAQKFNEYAQAVGFFQQQQRPTNQYGTQLASAGFQPGIGQYGQGTNPYAVAPASTAAAISPTGISSKITVINSDGQIHTDAPKTHHQPTGMHVSAPEPLQETFYENLEPSTHDRSAWLDYHAQRLGERGVIGPDFTSPRPYDMMMFAPDDDIVELWIPAHLSPYEMDPDPDTGVRHPRAYSPAHSVRFIVFSSDGLPTREDYLHMADNPDMRYLALEQGARPRDMKRVGLMELGKALTKIKAVPSNIIPGDQEEPTIVTIVSPLSEALEQIAMSLTKSNLNAVMVANRQEGEIHALVQSPDSKGSSMYVECKPYFVTPAEMAFVDEINEAGSLNELSKVFAKYSPVPVEFSRVYDILNRRLTSFFQPIFEFEFGLQFDDFANDIQDLLNAVLLDHGNEVLVPFTKRARELVPMALGVMDTVRSQYYITEALTVPLADFPVNHVPLVLSDSRVVIDVPEYSDTLGFRVSSTPSTLDSSAVGLTEAARGVIDAIILVHQQVVGDYGDVQVYVRTKDDVRLELMASTLRPELLTIRTI